MQDEHTILLPLKDPYDANVTPHPLVEEFLRNNNYASSDYISGRARDTILGVQVDIPKVLQKYNASQKILDAYNADEYRRLSARQHKDYHVAIKYAHSSASLEQNQPHPFHVKSNEPSLVAFLVHNEDLSAQYPLHSIEIERKADGTLVPMTGATDLTNHGAFHHTVNTWVNEQNKVKPNVDLQSSDGAAIPRQ